MPDSSLQPITKNRHGALRWHGGRFNEFVANHPLMGMSMGELSASMAHYTLAFAKESEDNCTLVALAGLRQGQNLLVGAHGQWLLPYVPGQVRAYPFAVGRTEDGQQLLCVREGPALVREGEGSQPFFEEDGSLSAPVKHVLDFLNQLESSRAATTIAANALHAAGVLEPWTIQIEGLAPEHWLPGLLRVNEAALNALPDDQFLELRRVGALPLAHAQMLSTGNLQKLVELARARAQAEQAAAAQAPVQAVAQAAGGPAPVTADFSGDTFKFH